MTAGVTTLKYRVALPIWGTETFLSCSVPLGCVMVLLAVRCIGCINLEISASNSSYYK